MLPEHYIMCDFNIEQLCSSTFYKRWTNIAGFHGAYWIGNPPELAHGSAPKRLVARFVLSARIALSTHQHKFTATVVVTDLNSATQPNGWRPATLT